MKKIILVASFLLAGCVQVFTRAETHVVCQDNTEYRGEVWFDNNTLEYIIQEPTRTIRVAVDDCYLENP